MFNDSVYSLKLPLCTISKDSICILDESGSLLTSSSYCYSVTSSTLGNIYVGLDSTTGKCSKDKTYMSKPGNYFFNSDYHLMRSANVIETGYLCFGDNGSDCEEMKDGFYINSVSSTNNYVIAYNEINTATASKNIFIENFNQFFINSGIEREGTSNKVEYPLLRCDNKNCAALSINSITTGFYINSGDTTQTSLIECDKSDCFLVNTPIIGYYINANYLNDINHPIIHCNESQGTCNLETLSSLDSGYYINAGSEANNSLLYCNSDECTVLTLLNNLYPGYYINAGDSSAPIITCDQNSCSSGPDIGTNKKGSYQFINNSIKFRYIDNDVIGCDSDLDLESLYFLVELEAGTFPGISTIAQTLFKISKNSITQVIMEGYLPIGKSDLKIKSGKLEVDNSIDLYHCSKTTKICTLKSSCSNNTFILNPIIHKAYYCSSNILKEVIEDGYYIDGGRIVKLNTPYLIKCNKGICESLISPLNYYINAGVNYELKNSNSQLIYCSLSNCQTVPATIGYYLAVVTAGDNTNRGIIYCSSNSKCVEYKSSIESKYYINAGAVNNSDILIYCYQNSCKGISAISGYYIAPQTSQLIFCPNSNHCSLIDANIGYYPLANKINSKKVINCFERPDKIYCEIQDASTGYYISAQSGILIDCISNGNQCFTMAAIDGIYRSATIRYSLYARYIN
eukprot:jgi/Orpsp1_1/1190307/evm.model.d7180000078141.1